MKKREIVKRSKIYSIVYIYLTITILLLSIGFSSYSERLAINGGAMIRPNLNARITDVEINNVKNGGLVNVNAEHAAYTMVSDITLPNSNSTVTFNITVANMYSDNVYITNVENTEYSNNNIEYTFQNLNINETAISPASLYTFQITFKYKDGASISNKDLNSILTFTFDRAPVYTFEINATPNESNIEMSANGKTYTSSNGFLSHAFDKGTIVNWKVSKSGYYDQTGVQTINNDISKDVVLEEMPHGTFTVNPTPSDSIVTIKQGDTVLKTGTGSQTVTLAVGEEISYAVTKLEYYDYDGTFTIVDENRSVNVNLIEMPWIIGAKNINRTTAATTTEVNYHPGYYLIEVWGGRGGYGSGQSSGQSLAGSEGYVYGVIELKYGDTIYSTAGGNGSDNVASGPGGSNGGGTAGNDNTQPAGSGGGYSAFAIGTTTIDSTTINNGSVIMIAGGGGGGSGLGGKNGDSGAGNGGSGGTLTSAKTTINGGTVFSGNDGTYGKKEGQGYGGSSTAGNSKNGGTSGASLTGGSGSLRGGGGGSGYFGGGGGGGDQAPSSTNYGPGGGGGGSSFVAADVQYTNLSNNIISKLVGTNPSTTGGAIIITYIGKSLE